MLDEDSIKRYSRQIIIPEIGEEGQVKLFNSSVLVIGAGGLGSAAIQYLAGAGVGRIGIVDGDVVDISNLHRQQIHAGKLGKNKAISAREFVKKLNPRISVDVYAFNINPYNIRDIIRKYDVILDCTDNFCSKFLINDACVLERKPLVLASVLRFEGQIITIIPGETACYRCLFKRAPSSETLSARVSGIIGTVPGVFGVLQAMEAIKIILGYKNELLTNTLLYIDLLNMEFLKVKVRKDENCPICSGRVKEIIPEKYRGSCEL